MREQKYKYRINVYQEVRLLVKTCLMQTYTRHNQGNKPNAFVFSTPRSGSTWLMEMILTQPGFRYCDEPFNIRTYAVRKWLGSSQWQEFCNNEDFDKVEKYFQRFMQNKPCHAKLKHVLPFSDFYQKCTDRTVFKILHAGEDQFNWFAENFNGIVFFLIRHPIPVSLSRKFLPRLPLLVNSMKKNIYTEEQIQFAQQILESGSKLEKGVLDWCLQNYEPLKNFHEDWCLITYEQLLVDPLPAISVLAEKLQLPYADKMKQYLNRPSSTTWQSDSATKSAFNKDGSKNWLLEKWRKKIDHETETKLMNILNVFGIDIYSINNVLPNKRYWISETDNVLVRTGMLN